MAHFDPLLERNRHFATTNAREGAAIVARHPVYVITCLDPRTDPSAFLELGLGDAIVVRNVGGRVSPDVLTDLAYIGYLSARVNPAGAGFEVVGSYTFPAVHEWTPDSLIGYAFSTSTLSRSALGRSAGSFEADLRRALSAFAPADPLTQTIRFAYVLARRPGPEPAIMSR